MVDQESLSSKGNETFKILQTKKKKGEEETLYVSNLQKEPLKFILLGQQ